MNANAQHVVTEALKLSDGDRMELVEALVVSIQAEERSPFSASLSRLSRW
jgi:hypothetical protein